MKVSLNADLFWSLFNPGIPLSVYASCLVVGSIGSAIILLNKTTANRHIVSIWLLMLLFLMLYTTVIGREPQSYHDYHLMPLWSLQAIKDGLIETLYEKIYNVLLFVPYGFLLGLYFKKCLVRNSIFVGFATSFGIELLQLITRTGTCETDDVICNTMGCWMGMMVEAGICFLIGKIRNQ